MRAQPPFNGVFEEFCAFGRPNLSIPVCEIEPSDRTAVCFADVEAVHPETSPLFHYDLTGGISVDCFAHARLRARQFPSADCEVHLSDASSPRLIWRYHVRDKPVTVAPLEQVDPGCQALGRRLSEGPGHISVSEPSSPTRPSPCITSATSASSEVPNTLAAFSSAPTTALGKLTFTSLDGPDLAHSLSSTGVRGCQDNSSER